MFNRSLRLPAPGTETFFLMRVAIEAKAAARITSTQLRGLPAIVRDHPGIEQRIVVCLEAKSRRTEDDILILPAMDFCRRLSAGELF